MEPITSRDPGDEDDHDTRQVDFEQRYLRDEDDHVVEVEPISLTLTHEELDAYELKDTKHPDHHDASSELWDNHD